MSAPTGATSPVVTYVGFQPGPSRGPGYARRRPAPGSPDGRAAATWAARSASQAGPGWTARRRAGQQAVAAADEHDLAGRAPATRGWGAAGGGSRAVNAATAVAILRVDAGQAVRRPPAAPAAPRPWWRPARSAPGLLRRAPGSAGRRRPPGHARPRRWAPDRRPRRASSRSGSSSRRCSRAAYGAGLGAGTGSLRSRRAPGTSSAERHAAVTMTSRGDGDGHPRGAAALLAARAHPALLVRRRAVSGAACAPPGGRPWAHDPPARRRAEPVGETRCPRAGTPPRRAPHH